MVKAIFGNHCAVRVSRTERDRIRKFYRDILGCKIMREFDDRISSSCKAANSYDLALSESFPHPVPGNENVYVEVVPSVLTIVTWSPFEIPE